MELAIMACLAAGRILVGVIFIAAGVAKRRAGQARFTEAIMGYDVLPKSWARVAARALPWVEIVLGGLLVAGAAAALTAAAGALLLLAFCAAITHSLVRGRRHHCGCIGFSAAEVREIQWRLVYRNLALSGVTVAVCAASGGALALDAVLPWRLDGSLLAPATLAIWLAFALGIPAVHMVRRARAQAPSSTSPLVQPARRNA